MGIKFTQRGSFDNTERYLRAFKKRKQDAIIRQYAQQGVTALQLATPKDSGVSAQSWKYEIEYRTGGFSIYWTNDNVTKTGTPIVVLIQYGHGTGSGEFIAGRDFINPAIRPIFEKISQSLWKEVSSI